MKFTETTLKGAYVIDLEKLEDERGFFARAWCRNEFLAKGLSVDIVQANVAFNKQRGILRGMHRQIRPAEEVKVVRCIRGSIFDAIVDLREHSKTYKQWIGVELTADNHKALYVPEGFGHGYLTLEDDSEVFYQVSQFYSPEHEKGVRWNDPAFGIEWPDMDEYLISEKDQAWPDYESRPTNR